MDTILDIFTSESGGYFMMLLAAIILTIAVHVQNVISQRFQFKLLTRWHICFMFLLLISPIVSYFLFTNRCRSLELLTISLALAGLFAIASVPLGAFNTSRTNLKYGVLATLVQMCGFALALSIGAAPVVLFDALRSMGAAGMHACR